MKKKIIFLGGTCGTNTWRDRFIAETQELATKHGITMFNPVVADWNAEAQAREDEAKLNAYINVFYIADPGDGSTSFYSLCEAVMGLYDSKALTLVAFDSTGMPAHAVKAMDKARKDLAMRFPGHVVSSMEELIEVIQ